MDPAGDAAPRVVPRTSGSGLLELLVHTITDYAIFALDPDGIVTTWNAGAERLKGYRADEIIGSHFSRFYTDEDQAAGKPDQDLAVAVADGHQEDEGWRVRNDGTVFWANAVVTALRGDDGRLVGFGKVTRDLTERKRAEEALRASEERFRLLVTSVGDYAIFLLDPDGTIASWNVGAERLKGYRPDEIIGRHVSTFYTEQDRRNGVPAVALATARRDGRWESEGWRVRRDGTRFWANVVITSLVAGGEHRGFAKVTRDLTDRKRNEDALRGVLEREREAAARLRELDRMRSELVAIIAHDLRAPVGVIEHLLHLLRREWSSSSDEEKLLLLDRVAARVENLATLADDVFDASRQDAGQLDVVSRPLDVRAIVETVVLDANTQAPDHDIRALVDGDVHAIGDDRRSWQVLSNLVSNAVKFSPPGSVVEVSVERRDDEVVIAVTDQGPGIPAEQVDRVFDRFTRLPQAQAVPGSGLGLFIAQSLAEAQGGSISVESTEGVGSTFRFVLPAAS